MHTALLAEEVDSHMLQDILLLDMVRFVVGSDTAFDWDTRLDSLAVVNYS